MNTVHFSVWRIADILSRSSCRSGKGLSATCVSHISTNIRLYSCFPFISFCGMLVGILKNRTGVKKKMNKWLRLNWFRKNFSRIIIWIRGTSVTSIRIRKTTTTKLYWHDKFAYYYVCHMVVCFVFFRISHEECYMGKCEIYPLRTFDFRHTNIS